MGTFTALHQWLFTAFAAVHSVAPVPLRRLSSGKERGQAC